MSEEEKKDDIVYIEDAATHVEDYAGRDPAKDDGGIVKSRYESLTITQALWKFKVAGFYCFLTFTAGLMISYELNMAGSIIANEGFMQQFGVLQPDGSYVIDTTWVSAWGAIINVGQIVAMTHTPYIADRFGRRTALILAAFYCLLALVFCTVARSPPVWLMGKLFIGVGVGMQQVVGTPYVIEVAPDVCRGALIALGGVWGGIGGVGSTVMMQVLNQERPMDWKLMVYLEYPFVAIMIIGYVLIPETPWYYGRRSDKRGGLKTMRRLYGSINGYDFEEEWGIIVRTVEHERQMLAQVKATPWSDCFKGLNGKRMLILTIMCTGQQVGGNALVGTYSTYFFQFAGLQDPFLGSMIQSIIGLVTSICYTLAIDKIGRRLISCVSYTVVTICLWLMGAIWYAHTDAAGRVLLGLVCIYQPFWNMYCSTYPILAAELPSVQLRMKTGTIVWFYQALWGILCCFAVPPLLTLWNVRAAFLFAGLSVPVMVYLWFFLPETKQRSISEVDELFERGVPAWKWRKTVTNAELHLRATQAAEAAAQAATSNTLPNDLPTQQ